VSTWTDEILYRKLYEVRTTVNWNKGFCALMFGEINFIISVSSSMCNNCVWICKVSGLLTYSMEQSPS
jgi:hypothetical protein